MRGAVPQARCTAATEAQAEASVPKITLHVIDVSFAAISDPNEGAVFMNLLSREMPSFVIPAKGGHVVKL
jgi:hypothetical protein